MAENKVGTAFVELATKGLGNIQADFNKLRELANRGAKPVNVPLAIKGETAQKIVGALYTVKGAVGGINRQILNSFKTAGEGAVSSFSGIGSAVAASVNKISVSLDKLGKVAQKSFFGATAAIAGFVKLASPKEADDLAFAFAALGIQIGRIFLPLLRLVTAALQAAVDWMKSLSDEQRASILRWAEIGLAVAGVIAILPRLASALQLALSPLGLLIGAAAVALPLLSKLTGVGGGQLGGAFAGVADALSNVMDAVGQTFGQVASAIVNLVKPLMPMLAETGRTLLDLFTKVAEGLIRIFGPLMQLLGNLFQTVASSLIPIINKFLVFAGQVFDALMPVVQAVIDIFNAFIPVLGTVLDAWGKLASNAMDALLPMINAVVDCLKPLLSAFIEVAGVAGQVLAPIMQVVSDVFNTTIQIVSSVFTGLVEVLKPIITLLSAFLKPSIELLGIAVKWVADGIRTVINGFIRMLNSILEWWNKKKLLPGKFKLIKEMGADEAETYNPKDSGGGGGGEDFEVKPKGLPGKGGKIVNKGDFRGEVRQKAPEIMGIAEAWRKAQTAQGEDLQSRIQREQLAESKKQNDKLDRIIEQGEKKQPWDKPGNNM